MWWIIGALIGTAWNLHDEKKNPELRAKREKQAQADRNGCFAILIAISLVTAGIVLVSVIVPPPSSRPIGSAKLNSDQSTDSAKISSPPNSPAGPLPAIPRPEAKAPTPLAALELSPAPPPAAATATEVSPTHSPPAIPETPPTTKPAVLTEASYHGTADTNFAKDWVIVEGKMIGGITRADAVPGGQVAILYSDGGKDVPASSLPQGFLDAWQLTPEKLKAAGNQQ